ncbi:DUF2599 domain-containing protein [Pseudomonas putida]|uniref:DUF2599 domain-containing protein n=1 Tax=Pseudomonas putida TaxID=303 RepID=UPI0034D443C9
MNALSVKRLPVFLFPMIILSSVVYADSCESVVEKLDTWYSSTPSGCGVDPAVDCSGIMLRATHRAPNGEYDVWNPSPNSEKSGGISVSWMRSDRVGYEDPGMLGNNGIIFTPRAYVREPQKKIDVVCAFPIDAWTDYRTERGCGDNSLTANLEENSCQALGADDLAGWRDQYTKLGGSANRQDRHKLQCAFSMKRDMSRTARRDAFNQFIAARQSIADTTEGRQVQTELRVAAWNKGDDVPVAAFFYSNPKGKQDAMKNQFDYYQRTGRWVPVVSMGFPANASQKTRFACEQGAQHRDLPRPVAADAKCPSYIDSAQWVQRDDPFLGKGVWTLAVTPTDCGRAIKADQTDAMYTELVRKFADDPRWSGSGYGGGMRRQLVCHMTLVDKGRAVRNKETFNLEPARPDVSHQASLDQGCNPYPAVRYP